MHPFDASTQPMGFQRVHISEPKPHNHLAQPRG